MKKNSLQNRMEDKAHKLTGWVGSIPSILLHSVFFLACLLSPLFGLDFDRTLLFLTTIVSLEAIYLSILIQFTVNKSKENIEKVEKDIDEIQEDIDEIQEDVGEIQEDIDEIQEDVGEIQEDVEEIEEDEEEKEDSKTKELIVSIQKQLETLIKDIDKIKTK